MNRADAGSYAAALHLAAMSGGVPDVTATRRNGTLKYGFGVRPEAAAPMRRYCCRTIASTLPVLR